MAKPRQTRSYYARSLPVVLACLVGAVFLPVVRFDFIDIDVPEQVIDNPYIRAITVENLQHIFTTRCISSYYPVRTLTYMLDHAVWGPWPGGFKLTNVLIHLLNVLLVYGLIRRFLPESDSIDDTKGDLRSAMTSAAFAAIFAVHPVVVEPVAWVAGREELLMTLGALACVHFHMTARRSADRGSHKGRVLTFHVAATISCAAACLSNAVGAVIPAIATTWDFLMLRRVTLIRLLGGTAALWALGIMTFVIKRVGEFHEVAGEPDAFSFGRVAIVLKFYAINLRTLVWPTRLSVFPADEVPRSFLEPAVLAGAAAALATCAAFWFFRRERPLVFGLAWFVLALVPTSQLMPHHLHRADRFLYLPLVGLVLVLAATARSWMRSSRTAVTMGQLSVATALVLVLTVAARHQLMTWKNSLTVWQRCVDVNPTSGMGLNSLADNLAQRGEYERAIRYYEEAAERPPWGARAKSQLALLLVTCKDERLRDYERAVTLAEIAFQENPKFLHTLTGVYARYAQHLAERGKFREAISYYHQAIDSHPLNRQAMLELAELLVTCPDEELRDPAEAVRWAERAIQLEPPPSSDDLRILNAARAAAGSSSP